MEIKYQTFLESYPTLQKPGSSYVRKRKPITIEEISFLETTYNNGSVFPTSLREMLFLAGNYCYGLDTGPFNNQTDVQTWARDRLVENDRIISRPFFVIDLYNGNEQFLFVYLDEDQNDPLVYEANMSNDDFEFPYDLGRSLSEYVTHGMKILLSGENPF